MCWPYAETAALLLLAVAAAAAAAGVVCPLDSDSFQHSPREVWYYDGDDSSNDGFAESLYAVCSAVHGCVPPVVPAKALLRWVRTWCSNIGVVCAPPPPFPTPNLIPISSRTAHAAMPHVPLPCQAGAVCAHALACGHMPVYLPVVPVRLCLYKWVSGMTRSICGCGWTVVFWHPAPSLGPHQFSVCVCISLSSLGPPTHGTRRDDPYCSDSVCTLLSPCTSKADHIHYLGLPISNMC